MLKKFGVKITLFVMVAIVLAVGIILGATSRGTTNVISEIIDSQSAQANQSFKITLEDFMESALIRAEMIAGSNDVKNAVLDRDGERLKGILKNYGVGFDLITLCDAEGTVLTRLHDDKVGDSVIGQEAISTAIKTGKGISTIEKGTVIGISTRGSAAIFDYDGNVIGALTCGHDLSKDVYVDKIKQMYNCEATFFAGDERMSTTIVDGSGKRAIGTKADAKIVQAVMDKKSDFQDRITLFGHIYDGYYSPILIDGQASGMLFTGINVDSLVKQEQSLVVMFVLISLLLIVTVVITGILIAWSTNKTYWFQEILDAIPFPLSVTDMNMNWTFINRPVEQMLNVKRDDVVGKHCSNWGAAICKTSKCGVNCLRNGIDKTQFEQMGCDFNVNVAYLYNKKKVKIGHVELVSDISEMMRNQKAQAELINKVADSSSVFASSSANIAMGAQSLAQGSTQQAAAVEELSSSITEVSEQINANAQMALKASSLASEIMHNAEKGSEQMGMMTQAVGEINEAARSIEKVIKIIDDIAFQTNILALNAAVEAARAGQHGKGFAVVAEEVRNLAAKSSEAARDTGVLITNSIEKAGLGARIANETATSLNEIVSGIGQSSEVAEKIAVSSNEQSTAIKQIQLGVDQIAQVVQQNSATAEQSAAASQELSGQSTLLDQLVTEFRNKETTDGQNEARLLNSGE